MMIYNCELGLNYDQFDNVIVILLKLFLELYFYRENYLQIDRLQSFSFLYIKLILMVYRKLSYGSYGLGFIFWNIVIL